MGSRGSSSNGRIKLSFNSYKEVRDTLDRNGKTITDGASDAVLLRAYEQARALSNSLDGGSAQINATNQARDAWDILMQRDRKDFGRAMAVKLNKIDQKYGGVSGIKDYEPVTFGSGLDLYRESTKKL